MKIKVCKKCGFEGRLEDFPKHSNGKYRGSCHKCTNAMFARFAQKYRDLPGARNKFLVKKFGITEDQYNQQVLKQGGGCAICKRTKCPTGRNLAVDHDHNSNEIRGLLCAYCNTVLGKMNDDPSLLREAAMYLESTTYRIERTY